MSQNDFKMVKKKTTRKRKVRRKSTSSKSEPIFVGLGDPVELRRNILEPTREVIQFLQSYEEFKKVKEEKTYTIGLLKDDLKEIKATINKLRRLLPRSKIKAERTFGRIKKDFKSEQSEPKPEPSPTPEPKPEPKPVPVAHPELDSLERELGEIEKKLGSLD
tara:strand:- start:200 stop:685 length:486 start_codon:yes stop_codon:yes gene_type:complete